MDNCNLSNLNIPEEEKLWYLRPGKEIPVGSYLSQYLANLYLSDLYHGLEGLHRIRITRSGYVKTYKVVAFQAFYMDDILILAKSAKHILRAVEYIKSVTSDLGLTIKDNWRCFKIGDSFIDIDRKELINMINEASNKQLKIIQL